MFNPGHSKQAIEKCFSHKCRNEIYPSLVLNNIKDTHRAKAPSSKTPALRKSTNMGVWAVVTLNQLFIRGS